jgi:hypothetical protein
VSAPMHERSVKAQATIRRRHAEAMLRGLRFVPETPFRVEPFTGGLIRDEQARHVTDYHIVDARGPLRPQATPHTPPTCGALRAGVERAVTVLSEGRSRRPSYTRLKVELLAVILLDLSILVVVGLGLYWWLA